MWVAFGAHAAQTHEDAVVTGPPSQVKVYHADVDGGLHEGHHALATCVKVAARRAAQKE